MTGLGGGGEYHMQKQVIFFVILLGGTEMCGTSQIHIINRMDCFRRIRMPADCLFTQFHRLSSHEEVENGCMKIDI